MSKEIWVCIWQCEGETEAVAAFDNEAAAESCCKQHNEESEREEREHLRKCHPDWTDDEVAAEVVGRADAREIGQHHAVRLELRSEAPLLIVPATLVSA